MSYIVPQKMPLRCFECGHISLSTIYGYGCKITHKSLESDPGINVRRPDWCQLVDIPTPHGRLGDLDALYEEISNGNKAYNGIDGYDGEYQHIGNADDCLDVIKYAETVIEAEGSEE